MHAYFRAVLDDLDDPEVPNVCLMAASLSADVLGADDLREYVLDEMRTLEAALVARLRVAALVGELPEDFDAETTAQVIVTFLQVLFRVVRVLKPRADMERQVHALLGGLGL